MHRYSAKAKIPLKKEQIPKHEGQEWKTGNAKGKALLGGGG
jgi:hypothetical protein